MAITSSETGQRLPVVMSSGMVPLNPAAEIYYNFQLPGEISKYLLSKTEPQITQGPHFYGS